MFILCTQQIYDKKIKKKHHRTLSTTSPAVYETFHCVGWVYKSHDLEYFFVFTNDSWYKMVEHQQQQLRNVCHNILSVRSLPSPLIRKAQRKVFHVHRKLDLSETFVMNWCSIKLAFSGLENGETSLITSGLFWMWKSRRLRLLALIGLLHEKPFFRENQSLILPFWMRVEQVVDIYSVQGE